MAQEKIDYKTAEGQEKLRDQTEEMGHDATMPVDVVPERAAQIAAHKEESDRVEAENRQRRIDELAKLPREKPDHPKPGSKWLNQAEGAVESFIQGVWMKTDEIPLEMTLDQAIPVSEQEPDENVPMLDGMSWRAINAKDDDPKNPMPEKLGKLIRKRWMLNEAVNKNEQKLGKWAAQTIATWAEAEVPWADQFARIINGVGGIIVWRE